MAIDSSKGSSPTKSSHFGSLLSGGSTLFNLFKVVLNLKTVVTKVKEVVVFAQL